MVLTGRGVVSPLGIGLAEHWRGLREGRSAIGPVENIWRQFKPRVSDKEELRTMRITVLSYNFV